jgi:hypothetical protein
MREGPALSGPRSRRSATLHQEPLFHESPVLSQSAKPLLLILSLVILFHILLGIELSPADDLYQSDDVSETIVYRRQHGDNIPPLLDSESPSGG